MLVSYSTVATRSIYLAVILALMAFGLAYGAATIESGWRFSFGALALLALTGAGACIGTWIANREAMAQAVKEAEREAASHTRRKDRDASYTT